MDNNNSRTSSNSNTGIGTIGQIIGRFIVATIILGITAFFTPGFSINNIWALGVAAVVLTVMDYLIIKFTGLHAMAFGKGFVGFILAVVALYATQYFVAGYSISWFAAIVGALIYGVIDYIMPGEQNM
ncbi:MAG: phage holin family protein [Clostridia bacterium]|nr:phage holin family protein [Clostridia bacterium]